MWGSGGLQPGESLRVGRFEVVLLAASFAGWIVTLVHLLGWVSLAGAHRLDFYRFFSVAAASGWLVGNLCLYRRRRLGASRRLLAIYLLGPPGLLSLLWAMGPPELQAIAPFAPLYGLGVYSLFFLVPITLTRS